MKKSPSESLLPTVPMVYAVVTQSSIVDNPDVPSYQPYVSPLSLSGLSATDLPPRPRKSRPPPPPTSDSDEGTDLFSGGFSLHATIHCWIGSLWRRGWLRRRSPPLPAESLLSDRAFCSGFLILVAQDSQKYTGIVKDCCCDYKTVDSLSLNGEVLHPLLQDLVTTPFFRYFKVKLWCDCPFWPDDGMCRWRDCSVCECPEIEFSEIFKWPWKVFRQPLAD